MFLRSSSESRERERDTQAPNHPWNAICKKKYFELLEELSLLKGLFSLEEFKEFGYNLTLKAFVEKGKLKKVMGMKVRGLLLWLTVVEVFIEELTIGKITFIKTSTGLFDSFHVSTF
uniref:Uncharacterized protein n=1 Tax=Ananas comosus var. bracteatus TaxID=296719 RepID=A0A6V7PFU3_ANACO|nr:unnamed protein product [Ananas comosus var. bracteatus]